MDFAGTGMAPAEIERRIAHDARIAASGGASFGTGGESFVRFNLATTRARVEAAVERMSRALATCNRRGRG